MGASFTTQTSCTEKTEAMLKDKAAVDAEALAQAHENKAEKNRQNAETVKNVEKVAQSIATATSAAPIVGTAIQMIATGIHLGFEIAAACESGEAQDSRGQTNTSGNEIACVVASDISSTCQSTIQAAGQAKGAGSAAEQAS